MAASTFAVFVNDLNDVYVSPNAEFLPTVPCLRPRFHEDGDPKNCLTIKWDQEEYPYIGFAPMNLRYKGVIFERLDVSSMLNPVEFVPATGRWRVRPEIVAKWLRLENALKLMGAVIFDNIQAFYVPLDYKSPPSPQNFGFTRDHKTKYGAYKALHRSQAAFTPLVGWCAWIFASAGGDLCASIPRWYTILLSSKRVHPEWLNEMCRNEIGDFSGNVKRVGMFVHLARCSWLNIIRVSINAKVPIWFYWGKAGEGYVKCYDKWVVRYRPSPQSISEAVRKRQMMLDNPEASNQCDKSQDDTRQLDTPGHHSEPQFPPPQPGSRQRPGEHWIKFFERIADEQKVIARDETASDRQSRLDREKHQSNHPFPGKKGPACFRWELVNGFRIRTSVTRREVEDIWDTIPNQHRRYNSFANVWDINPEFDPNVDEDYVSDDGSPERYPSPVPRSPPSNPNITDSYAERRSELLRFPETQASVSSSHVLDDLIETVGNTVHETTVNPEAMEDRLYFRYGFLPTNITLAPITQTEKLQPWSTLGKILGDSAATPGKSYCQAVAHFVKCALDLADEQNKTILMHLCDLHTELRDHIEQNPSNVVCIRPIRFADNVVRFLLQPNVPSNWFIILDTALSAVECLRRPEYKPEDIVSRLVKHGIPFRTIITGPPPAHRPPIFYFGLGYCQMNYKPTTVDYIAYERARDDFLRGPRGQAALMKGGIIWRLAMQTLHADVVVAGPSESVYGSGVWFPDNQSGKHWWDDDLTAEEMGLISGVYKVFTGKGTQTSDQSWWPKHSAWEGSGADFGFWSASNEMWFQNRLAEIRAGTAILRNGGHWKNALSFHKATRRFITANESLAAQFLGRSAVF